MRWLLSDLPEDRRLFETRPASVTGNLSRVLSALALALIATAMILAGLNYEWIVLIALVATFVLVMFTPVLFGVAIVLPIINGEYVVAGVVLASLIISGIARAVGRRHARKLGYDL